MLYKTNQFEGELTSSDEGEVFWIKREELSNYQLANDFEQMLKVFESDQISEFYYEKDQAEFKISLF